ncbi:MAG: DNA gyrase inhibitor YacG [Phaeospirillum sp.]|nr:DNA gyrase inhibitor YacG [Phaeospirillum sp.]
MTTTIPCPICGKPAEDPKYKPFCCGRCADVDLHRWLGGVYRIETNEPGEETEQ